MSSPSLVLLEGDPTTWGIPPVGKTFVGINQSGQLVLKQNDGTITVITSSAPGINTYANSAGGPTTITAAAAIFLAILSVTGSARTVQIILDTTVPPADGDELEVLAGFLALTGLNIAFYSGSISGPNLLYTFNSGTGSGITNGLFTFYALGGVWNLKTTQVPANS